MVSVRSLRSHGYRTEPKAPLARADMPVQSWSTEAKAIFLLLFLSPMAPPCLELVRKWNSKELVMSLRTEASDKERHGTQESSDAHGTVGVREEVGFLVDVGG